jgi:hypothetical protein
MTMRHFLLPILAAWLLASCGGGPVKRVSPPTASVQELEVRADHSWRLLVRVQNFSNVAMTFSAIDARLEIEGADMAGVSLPLALDIPGGSADVFETIVMPTSGGNPGTDEFAYRLHGRIQTSDPRGDYAFERKSRLSPVPGLADTWR